MQRIFSDVAPQRDARKSPLHFRPCQMEFPNTTRLRAFANATASVLGNYFLLAGFVSC